MAGEHCEGLTHNDAMRFVSKIEAGPQFNGSSCWLWTGARNQRWPYGRFWSRNRMHQAHRVSYEAVIGVIPPGLEIDHLCRNHLCVNPLHLEAVTHRVNVMRGVSPTASHARRLICHRGHDEWRRCRNGQRRCAACQRIRNCEPTQVEKQRLRDVRKKERHASAIHALLKKEGEHGRSL